MTIGEIIAISTEIITLIGVVIPVVASISKIAQGTKCQLRSEMLRVYYKNLDKKEIRQFELENFIKLYEAYKALHGNLFIDRVYNEVLEWKVNK
jgi:hypothetical protein